MRNLIVSILTAFSVSAWAQSSDPTPMIEALAATVGRPLSSNEIKTLSASYQRWQRGLWKPVSETAIGSNVLFCVKTGGDLYVGASVAGCVDLDLTPYYSLSIGAGIAIGFELTAFTMVYKAVSILPVEGTYYGGKASVAYGFLGGTVGVFTRPVSAEAPDVRDRLFVIGYTSGYTLDFAGSVMFINRFY